MDKAKFTVTENISVFTAMKRINDNGQRILIVIDDDRVVGVVTDGDIRRYILTGGDLNADITGIINRDPISLSRRNLKQAKELFLSRHLAAIPVIDSKGILKSVVVWEDVFSGKQEDEKLDLPVVIMAGGKGSRLYPYTQILPKPLIPIGEIPIVERIMKRFTRYGIKNFFMTVNYKKNMIKAYFNELQDTYSIQYVEEEKPLGTAGSLYLLKKELEGTFIVTNCDILIDANYSKLVKHHKEQENAITIVSSLKHEVIPYGVIVMKDDETIGEIREKPEFHMLVNTGMYIVEADVMSHIPDNEFFHMTDLIQVAMDREEKVGVFPISEEAWLDMGQFTEMEHMLERLQIDE